MGTMEKLNYKLSGEKYHPRPLVLGLIFIILILGTFRASFIEPEFKKDQFLSESIPPFTILVSDKEKLSEATKEKLIVLSKLLLQDGFGGEEIVLALGEANGRRASVVLKPTVQVPLSYFEIQKIVRVTIKANISRPNRFIEEGYSRLLASKLLGLDPHRFVKAIQDAGTIIPLTDAIMVEGVRIFTPRARFQSESFTAYLLGKGLNVLELLKYSSRELISSVVVTQENDWRDYLTNHPAPISIKELRAFLIEWDQLFREVAASIRMIYPPILKPISLLYREAIHNVEVMNKEEFKKTNEELTTLLNRMPKLKEEKSVWSLPKYWEYLRTWLVSMFFIIVAFYFARKLKIIDWRVLLILLGGLLAQAYTFLFLHIWVSLFIEISLLLTGITFMLFFLVDESSLIKTPPPKFITSFVIPFLPLPLLWLSLKVSGYPYFEGFLLAFSLIAVFYYRFFEPDELGFTVGGMNLIIPVTILILAGYYFLPVKYQFDFENLTNWGIYTLFHLGWSTWCFTVVVSLLKPYLSENFLMLLAPAVGFLGEYMLRTPLLTTEALGFWISLSFIFWLTKSLPLIWSLVLARSILLYIFLPSSSSLLFLPIMGITAIILLTTFIKYLFKKGRLNEGIA